MATVSGGRTVSPVLSPCDTRERAADSSQPLDGPPHAQAVIAAAEAWRAVTPSLAGTPHVRTSRDGGRTFPARHARPLPAAPPEIPATVPVYDAAAAAGQLLVLDLDPSRGDVDHQAAELGQLLERLGARYVADVATSTGGRHILIPFASPLLWLELRDLCRAIAARFPVVDPAPICSLGGQISPPGSRAKRGGWRVLSTPVDSTLAAVERPNEPEVWAGLLREFAAELQQVENVPRWNHFRQPQRSSTTTAPRGCPAPAAALRSALSLSRRLARDGGIGHATRAAPKYAWRFWAPRLAASRRAVSDRLRSLEGPSWAVREALRARPA